jgi:hypothetical protein
LSSMFIFLSHHLLLSQVRSLLVSYLSPLQRQFHEVKDFVLLSLLPCA